MAHSSVASEVACGLRSLPATASAASAAQAAWRFFSNPEVTLPQLAQPLIDAAREAVKRDCARVVLVPLDWSRLDYGAHVSKEDRVVLQNKHDLGYKLLTGLAVSDRTGAPIAPLCLELKAADGVHSTRQEKVLRALSPLDGLGPVMRHIQSLGLALPAVFIIDREAESVLHFRLWSESGHQFLVRADESSTVLHAGVKKPLKDAATAARLEYVREVECKGVPARQYVGETTVVLARPASPHRTVNGKRVKQAIHGQALTLRLVVSEVRDEAGKVLARWLLLTNLLAEIDAATVALWYYWRWRIESYHKLLKCSGQQVEHWQQEDAVALSRRLLVSAMACVVVWHLARDLSAQAAELRELLVRLSGRQMKRGKNARGYTEPALLAGLGVLMPMLELLERIPLEKLKSLARSVLPYWSDRPSG